MVLFTLVVVVESVHLLEPAVEKITQEVEEMAQDTEALAVVVIPEL